MHASESFIPGKGVMDEPARGESLGVALLPPVEKKQPVQVRRDVEPIKKEIISPKKTSEKIKPVVPTVNITKAGNVSTESTSEPAASTDVKPVDQTDWSVTEITGLIKDAYIVVYPKRKFIGLVKGKKYIRKYYNISVPEKLDEEKETAEDGRCPYGNYFVAARQKSEAGLSLTINYPSSADAGKALASGRIKEDVAAKITAASKKRTLPPQETPLGGGVMISADSATVSVTKGGFAMEPEQLEELYLATQRGTWVIIKK